MIQSAEIFIYLHYKRRLKPLRVSSIDRTFLLSSKTRFSQTFQIPFFGNKCGIKQKRNSFIGPRHGRRRFWVNIKEYDNNIHLSRNASYPRLKGARYTRVLRIIIMTDFASPTQRALIPRHIAAVLPVYDRGGGRAWGRGSRPAVNGSI